MWYKFCSYEESHNLELKHKERMQKLNEEHIKFLEEAKLRNPDKIKEIDNEISKILNRKRIEFPHDEKGGDFLYHSTNADLEELKEGLSPEYSADNLHNNFSGEGWLFFSDYPQYGYGENLLRVNRAKYRFRDDAGEYATKDHICPEDIEIYNGKNWIPLNSV